MSGRRTTRRSFIGAAGAAIAAPLAAAGPTLMQGTGLDEVAAIRSLSQAYARHVAAGDYESAAALFADPSSAAIDLAIRRVIPDGFGEHDAVAMAADGQSATAVLHCTVEVESAIGPACTLVEMARQQGGGLTRHTERGVFEITCVRGDGAWTIQRARFRTDDPGRV